MICKECGKYFEDKDLSDTCQECIEEQLHREYKDY